MLHNLGTNSFFTISPHAVLKVLRKKLIYTFMIIISGGIYVITLKSSEPEEEVLRIVAAQ